jgi:hypothetical protein
MDRQTIDRQKEKTNKRIFSDVIATEIHLQRSSKEDRIASYGKNICKHHWRRHSLLTLGTFSFPYIPSLTMKFSIAISALLVGSAAAWSSLSMKTGEK